MPFTVGAIQSWAGQPTHRTHAVRIRTSQVDMQSIIKIDGGAACHSIMGRPLTDPPCTRGFTRGRRLQQTALCRIRRALIRCRPTISGLREGRKHEGWLDHLRNYTLFAGGEILGGTEVVRGCQRSCSALTSDGLGLRRSAKTKASILLDPTVHRTERRRRVLRPLSILLL